MSSKKSKLPSSKPSTNDSSSKDKEKAQQVAEQEKFDRELLWCVQKLEHGLSGHDSKKGNQKQLEEAVRVLKILRSPSAPLVKKRQAMRNTFGDYRKKMQQEQKKYMTSAKKMTLKVTDKTTQQKSTYFRSSSHKSGITPTLDSGIGNKEKASTSVIINKDLFKKTNSSEQFQFGFNISENSSGNHEVVQSAEDSISDDLKMEKMSLDEDDGEINNFENECESGASNIASIHSQPEVNHYKLTPSDNSFRFNFEVN